MAAITIQIKGSSLITQAEYNPDTHNLTLWFKSGKPYTYYGVPPKTCESFKAAPSAGAYFNAFIREQYSANRVAA